jgi:hypothetical protein
MSDTALNWGKLVVRTIAQTLGRHTNDRIVSFYARTPSGFEVEFGFGAGWRLTWGGDGVLDIASLLKDRVTLTKRIGGTSGRSGARRSRAPAGR